MKSYLIKVQRKTYEKLFGKSPELGDDRFCYIYADYKTCQKWWKEDDYIDFKECARGFLTWLRDWALMGDTDVLLEYLHDNNLKPHFSENRYVAIFGNDTRYLPDYLK